MTSQRWLVLAAGATVTVVASLSVHVVMLQILGVPYPDIGKAGPVAMLIPLSQVLGMFLLARVIRQRFPHRSPIWCWLVLAGLYSAINGIGRNALMEGVTTTGYVMPAASLLYQAVSNLAIAAVVAALTPWGRSVPRLVVSAVGVTAIMLVALPAVLGPLFAPLMTRAAAFARPEAYAAPYGPDVLIPSYLAFFETVGACLLLGFVIATDRRATPREGWLRFGIVVTLVRGMLVAMFVAGPLIGPTAATGMASVSQFFLQDLVLVIFAYAVVRLAMRPRPGAPARSAAI